MYGYAHSWHGGCRCRYGNLRCHHPAQPYGRQHVHGYQFSMANGYSRYLDQLRYQCRYPDHAGRSQKYPVSLCAHLYQYGGGTSQSVPDTVGANPVPVNIGNDTTICPGITYTLDPGNPGGASYLWSTNATTQTITVNQAGNYSVLMTLPNGCTGSDARVITPGIVPQNNLPALTNLCEGETATLNAGNSGSSFSWTPGGATTQTLNVTTGGTKSVAIKSTTGCITNNSTEVVMRPLPLVDSGQ